MILESPTGELPRLTDRPSCRGCLGSPRTVMTSVLPTGSRAGLPPGRRRPGPGFFSGLVAITRLGLLAIIFAGTLNALANVFHGASVSRTVGAPSGVTFIALIMAAASTVLMVALTLNAAFLVGRLFSRRVAAYLTATVFVLAVGSVARRISRQREAGRSRDCYRGDPGRRVRAECAARALRGTGAQRNVEPTPPRRCCCATSGPGSVAASAPRASQALNDSSTDPVSG